MFLRFLFYRGDCKREHSFHRSYVHRRDGKSQKVRLKKLLLAYPIRESVAMRCFCLLRTCRGRLRLEIVISIKY